MRRAEVIPYPYSWEQLNEVTDYLADTGQMDDVYLLYTGFLQSRKYMQDILTAKQNAESLLNYRKEVKERENERA